MTHPNDGTTPAPTRRGFLGFLTWLVGGLATLAFVVPFVGFLFGGLRQRKPKWVELGPLKQFLHPGETRWVTFANPLGLPWDGMTAMTGVYVRYLGEKDKEHQFQVFASNCAHLGCPVSWFPQSGLFMCPCHGGVYYENGAHASGPPPRGLFECVWQVNKGKQLLEIQAPHLPTLQDTLRQQAREGDAPAEPKKQAREGDAPAEPKKQARQDPPPPSVAQSVTKVPDRSQG